MLILVVPGGMYEFAASAMTSDSSEESGHLTNEGLENLFGQVVSEKIYDGNVMTLTKAGKKHSRSVSFGGHPQVLLAALKTSTTRIKTSQL